MKQTGEFSFGDDSIARAYENILVPILFEPWGQALIEEFGPWQGLEVLDVACGTGVVSRLLTAAVGDAGAIVGMDMNDEMLGVAAEALQRPNLSYVVCPADALACADAAFDRVVCQQGFQFFPDKPAAAREMHRVLRDGGSAVVSVWRPVAESQYFGAIRDALNDIGQDEIAERMRIPFDFMPRDELQEAFASAGFADVCVTTRQSALVMPRGAEQAVETAWATPIGPALNALSNATQAAFKEALRSRAVALGGDQTTMGQMAADILTAGK